MFPDGVTLERADVDAGIVQKDALTPALDATCRWWRDLLFDQWERRLADEQAAIDRIDPAIVVADIAPLGVAASLAIGRAAVEAGERELWALSEKLWANVAGSRDAAEGPRAFTEKRAPVWTGR